jgi:hypothetical protein
MADHNILASGTESVHRENDLITENRRNQSSKDDFNFFFYLHSNEKLRVFATEAFRSEKSTETSNYSTEVSVETHETFESISRSP